MIWPIVSKSDNGFHIKNSVFLIIEPVGVTITNYFDVSVVKLPFLKAGMYTIKINTVFNMNPLSDLETMGQITTKGIKCFV